MLLDARQPVHHSAGTTLLPDAPYGRCLIEINGGYAVTLRAEPLVSELQSPKNPSPSFYLLGRARCGASKAASCGEDIDPLNLGNPFSLG